MRGQRVVGGERLGHPDQSAAGRRRRELGVGAHQGRRRHRERRGHELVTVAALSGQGDEEVAGGHAPRVDLGAGQLGPCLTLERAAEQPRDLRGRHSHSTLRASVRTTCWSEKGKRSPPIVW